jgi:hypothetical protein
LPAARQAWLAVHRQHGIAPPPPAGSTAAGLGDACRTPISTSRTIALKRSDSTARPAKISCTFFAVATGAGDAPAFSQQRVGERKGAVAEAEAEEFAPVAAVTDAAANRIVARTVIAAIIIPRPTQDTGHDRTLPDPHQNLVLPAMLALAVAAPRRTRRTIRRRARAENTKTAWRRRLRVPADGYETALTWAGQGGGNPARHCAAVALHRTRQVSRRRPTQWRALGRRPGAEQRSPPLAAEAFGQAAKAWTSANQPAKALARAEAGIKLAPERNRPAWWIAPSRRNRSTSLPRHLDDLNKAD